MAAAAGVVENWRLLRGRDWMALLAAWDCNMAVLVLMRGIWRVSMG